MTLSNLPAGTVTFLFTDIEGSTQLWEQHPEAMTAALARHDALLRQAVEAGGGRVVKATGDGLHAAFDTARQAAAASLAAQRQLQTPIGGISLRVRMAVHTGEATQRGGDYFGPAVNRAARLMSLAAGGQILLSATTADLVRDQLPAGAALRDLGEHRLKDLVRPERVYQLDAEGLPGEFPPLRSLDIRSHNLPVQLTSFIGREREMAQVKELLGATHLLTLTGPGGTGKTRLSLQVAEEVLGEFQAGAWLVELAPVSDPALVAPAVAAALGVHEQPGRALLETLLDYLRAKTLLLILDNCEHLVEACAQLAATLLRTCPNLKILASSREVLGVAGETAYRVPSLSCASLLPATPDELVQSEAARLFVERARSVQPHFALAPHNLGAVDQICQRLDGIPLAIELAAARVKLLSAEQIAARLDDRFRLLTGGSRAALPRQQTLGALIDWSYDLLSEAERAALRRLSVFAGGWTLEAAEALLGPEALDWLSHLVDKSLIQVEEVNDSGTSRYRLLETIRQYGRDKLVEAGEASTARDRHLAYYLRIAVEAEPKLNGPEMLPVLNKLELEHDNFRASLDWALERNPDAALRMAASLKYFWLRRSHTAEGSQWLRNSLARLGQLTGTEQTLRAKGLLALGTVVFGQGGLNAARSSLEESVLLSRQAGDTRTLALALGMLGLIAVWLGDEAATETVLAEGLSLAGARDGGELEAQFLVVQAQRAGRRREFAAARAYAQAAEALLRPLGNPWLSAITIMGLGALESLEGHTAEAWAHLEKAESLFGSIGDRHMATSMLSERAHIERRAGHFAQASALYAQTLSTYQELGLRPAALHELECLAYIASAQAQAARAARLLGAAEGLRESLNSPMTSMERAEYDQHLSALRAQLEPAPFAQAWAEGRALSLEQAAEMALSNA